MPAPKIRGRVAAILNDRELVLNVGEKAGVHEAMRFRILDEPRAVKDPETGEELGEVSKEKVRVKVVQVQPLLSIARTYETYQVNIGGLMPDFSFLEKGMFRTRKIVTRARTLRYDESVISNEPLDEGKSFVKVGDPAEHIEDLPEQDP